MKRKYFVFCSSASCDAFKKLPSRTLLSVLIPACSTGRQQNLVLQVTEKLLFGKAELGSTLRNMFPQLETLTFVA